MTTVCSLVLLIHMYYVNRKKLVDLIYAHRPDRNTPLEETVRAFNHIINTGKAFYWGTSEWNADEIASAHRIADKLGLIGPVMEQPEYNLLKRTKVEGDFALLYEHYGLGLTTFSPLAMGILAGKYLDGIPEESRIGTSGDSWVQHVKGKLESGDPTWLEKLEKVRNLKVCSVSLAPRSQSWARKLTLFLFPSLSQRSLAAV